MSFYVYVLYSASLNKNYTGYTGNLHQRIEAHNHPKNKMWTRLGKPWRLKAYFIFTDKADATEGEKHLKNYRNPTYIDKVIKDGWLFKGSIYQAHSLVRASDPD